MNKTKKAKKNTGFIVWVVVTLVVAILLSTMTVLVNTTFEPIISTVLGGETPVRDSSVEQVYLSEYNSKEESTEAGNRLNVAIESEGAVLLVNEEKALPLDGNIKVSVFGKNSVDLVLGGSGSGGISGVSAITLYDSLNGAGFSCNPTLKAFYESKDSGNGRSGSPELSSGSSSAPTLDIGETPIASYTSEVKDSFAAYSDAAIVVISRMGGESWDLPRSQNTANGGIEGNHYLQLDENEYELLDMVTSRFDKVIVVLNTLNPFQCDFIDEYNNTAADKRIDAVLWIGGPGATGAEAIGGILKGSVNPSGRTTDIYAKDFTKDPTWQNFGDNSQVNGGSDASAYLENGTAVAGQYYVAYEEGIYLGYRYYETRGYEELRSSAASTWYDDNVRFPFGYGLSYTSFEQSMEAVEGSLDDGNVTIKITSTNTGAISGKDVIELYVTLPYTRGGIEKSYIQLVDFAKTPVLAPGESYTAEFMVSAYDLASYDYNDANSNGFAGYELEAGDYIFRAGRNSHEYYAEQTAVLKNSVYFEQDPDTGYKVVNLYTTDDYSDIQYRLQDCTIEMEDGTAVTRKGMSRTDFEGTFPKAPSAQERELLSTDCLSEKDALTSFAHNNPIIDAVTDMPATGSAGVLTLRDMTGKDYDDPDWDALLDRLTFSEMLDLVNHGAFQTDAILSIEKNMTNDSDGPIGFVNFMPGKSESYTGNTTFACECVIAATWNKDLAYEMGEIVGENGLYGDENGNGLPYSGWYAPAVNLHRSAFSGRSFEYYSEDPILSGKLAVNVINGCAQKGVYTDLKHLALNEQETNRSGISTFCTEQALRELYLKPFEIAVKGNDDPAQVSSAAADGLTEYKGTTGVMSSFNRIGTRWTGGDYRLMTEILRNEWGFDGLVISDYKTDNSFMDSRQMLYAGNDLILASLQYLFWTDADAASAQDVTVLRNAAHNILYTVANSNSVNVKVIGYRMPMWKMGVIALDSVAALSLIIWGGFLFNKRKKENSLLSGSKV